MNYKLIASPTVRSPFLISPENSLLMTSSMVFLERVLYSSNTALKWGKLRWERISLNLDSSVPEI